MLNNILGHVDNICSLFFYLLSRLSVNLCSHCNMNVFCLLQVLAGLTKNISTSKYQYGKNSQESILDILPNTTKEQLLDVSKCRSCEFLENGNVRRGMERKERQRHNILGFSINCGTCLPYLLAVVSNFLTIQVFS